MTSTTEADEGRLLTTVDVARLLGVKPTTVRDWRARGQGPKPTKLGDSAQSLVRYHPDDVDDWIAKRRPAEGEQEQGS